MAAAPKKCGAALAIVLDNSSDDAFAAGDVVVGRVRREAPIVSPSVKVTIRLHGRCKAQIVGDDPGEDTSIVQSRGFRLLDHRETEQTLFDGILHIPPGGDALEWPFSVELPTRANHRILTRGVTQADSYLPLDEDSVAQQPLPASLSDYRAGVSARVEGTVEYFLEAHLCPAGQGIRDTFEARLPITLRTYSLEPPIVDFDCKTSLAGCRVSSQRLLPGMGDAKLSSSQKLKKFFGTKSVPELYFTVRVRVPRLLQLENPNALPFSIRITPRQDETSEELRNMPQEVTLTQASLKLLACTEVLCESALGPQRAEDLSEIDLHVGKFLTSLGAGSLKIPFGDGDDNGNSNSNSSLDIGDLINLRLGYNGAIGMKFFDLYRVCPTQTTYNIRHFHRLRWLVSGVIAGEHFEASGLDKVVVLPASES